jgi:hypothetical protein
MRFRQLRRILEKVVLAGLPVAMGACFVDEPDCYETVQRSLTAMIPADPQLQMRIDSCRVDVDACNALCTLALARAREPAPQSFRCDVEFLGDVVSMVVSYDVPTGDPSCPVEGRRPDGLAPLRGLRATSAAGAWLAPAAWLEAASVHAFVRLANELERHAAPRALIRGALAAVPDELRHTAMMTRLARRYGAVVPAPEVAAFVDRPLEQLAIENAVEGCVRETWGAVLALWQSHTARDPEVRAALRMIADDEIRHAALAWAIDRWAVPLLDDGARARVASAREAAARELLDGGDAPSLPVLGLPAGAELQRLARRTQLSLWNGGRSCHA